VSAIGFFLLRLSGDLARALAGQNATSEQVAAIAKAYGLDRPLVVQYVDWLGNFLQGDFGRSFYFKQPAADLILSRLPTTLLLGALGLGLALVVAVPLGVLAAVYRGSLVDRAALTLSALGQSMPNFWIALLMISTFGLTLRWLPISGTASWRNFIMPAVALAFAAQPAILRLTRAGMIDVLATDYIRTARAKGLPPATVLFKHALRNAVVPVVAVAAVQLGQLVGGSVVIESIFAIQGIGYLAWESITRTDFPVVQAILVVVSIAYVLLTLSADLLNAALDPRTRST
jgi:ABC-type dipeptide/oligopeptide/nickel transport system permease component